MATRVAHPAQLPGEQVERFVPGDRLEPPLAAALGELGEDLGRPYGGVLEIRPGVALEGKRLVEIEGEEAVRSIRPDMSALKALNVRGVIVTAELPGIDPEIHAVEGPDPTLVVGLHQVFGAQQWSRVTHS